jgi:cytochrome c biogenesis protein ResB
MKILIWLGFGVIHWIIANIIDAGGVAFLNQLHNIDGYFALFYSLVIAALKCVSLALCIFAAKKVCKKWDWHKATKEATRHYLSVKEYALKEFSQSEINELAELYEEQLKPRIKPMLKSGRITKSQYFILLETDFTEFIRKE